MTPRTFALPNFICKVQLLGEAEPRTLLLYGTDAASLEKRLKRRYPGVRVKSPVPYDFAQAWGEKAGRMLEAVEEAIEKQEKFDFNKHSIWGELKDWLFDLFDGKCAYCESALLGSSYGAVEHYRPKSPVDGEADHRGYYWLAYKAENYLPTCNRCNIPKSNKFPLEGGSLRARKPGEEAAEKALLLNPYLNPPEKHLAFRAAQSQDKAGPVAAGLTESGRQTIALLNLNRFELMFDRDKAQQQAVIEFLVARLAGADPNPVLQRVIEGSVPFAAACLAAIRAADTTLPGLGT